MAELHGAADLERLVTRELADFRLEVGNLPRKAARQLCQTVGVDEHARALHLGEHGHERHLDSVEHIGRVLAHHGRTQRLHERERKRRRPRGSSNGIGWSTVLALGRR